MEEREVDLGWIKIGDERRPVDDAGVQRLAESIAKLGLLERIGVRTDGTLIWGNYRVHAYRKLGRKQIPAAVLDLDELDFKLMEIDENLCRTDLTPVQRSVATAQRKEIYVARYPETALGGNNAGPGVRWGKHESPNNQDSHERPPSFVNATAKRTRQSPKTVEMYVRVGNAFTSDELRKLDEANLPILHLDKLASLRKSERHPEKVAEVLAAPVDEMRARVEPLLGIKEVNRTSVGRANRDRQEREASLARQTPE